MTMGDILIGLRVSRCRETISLTHLLKISLEQYLDLSESTTLEMHRESLMRQSAMVELRYLHSP